MPRPGLILLRFHLRVGARLALRALAPVVAAVCGAATFFDVPFLRHLGIALFPASGAASGASVVAAAAALAVAGVAAPRICRGLDGWMRHLPASGVGHRRAAILAVAAVQTPLLIGLVALAGLAGAGPAALLTRGWGLLTAALAAAFVMVPSVPVLRHRGAQALAFPAAALAVSGKTVPILVAVLLLVAADQVAGPVGRRGAGREWRRRADPGSGRFLAVRIAWRALGWKLVQAWVAAALPLAAAALFIANNDLPRSHVALVCRLGGAVSLVLFCAEIGEALAARRPAWPWLRSLPASAGGRVVEDALFLAVHAAPLLAAVAWLAPPLSASTVVPTAALLPYLATRAAGAMRRAAERRTGAAGEILLEGGLAAALVALLPWLSLVALAATPIARRAAADRERRQKVSRWLAVHHLAAGDPQSWSAT